MADISPIPVTDWGSLLTSFGQGQANAGLTNAQTGLVQQQTQNAQTQNQTQQMQNQVMQARLPVIIKALQDYGSSSDSSGTASGAAPANAQPLNADSGEGSESPETDRKSVV